MTRKHFLNLFSVSAKQRKFHMLQSCITFVKHFMEISFVFKWVALSECYQCLIRVSNSIMKSLKAVAFLLLIVAFSVSFTRHVWYFIWVLRFVFDRNCLQRGGNSYHWSSITMTRVKLGWVWWRIQSGSENSQTVVGNTAVIRVMDVPLKATRVTFLMNTLNVMGKMKSQTRCMTNTTFPKKITLTTLKFITRVIAILTKVSQRKTCSSISSINKRVNTLIQILNRFLVKNLGN